MRKCKVLLLTILCCLAFSLPSTAATSENSSSAGSTSAAAAPTIWDNQDTGYRVVISDDADLLTADEESLLLEEMKKITDYGNAVFKSVSENDTTPYFYGDDYYYELFGYRNGTLFLIDMDNRELCLISNGDISKTITNSYANTITDNVYSNASDGDYYRCALRAFQQVHELLTGHKIMQPMKYISNALLALILAALINYLVVMLCSGSSKASRKEILDSISTRFSFTNQKKELLSQTKTYSPVKSSSTGSHSGGSSHRSSSHRSSHGSHRF